MSKVKKALAIVKEIAHEVATLKRPVTATAVVGLLVTIIQPLGIHLDAEALAGILVAVGGIAATVEKIAEAVKEA